MSALPEGLGDGRSAADRLRVLEGLHRDGIISDEELRTARAPLVADLTGIPHDTSPPTAATPPASEPSRLFPRALPHWAVPAAIAAGAVVALVLVLVFALSGSDSAPPAQTTPLTKASASAVRQLNASASTMGRVLAKTSTAADLQGLKVTAGQQLDAADAVRVAVTQMKVPPEDLAAWQRLVHATGLYRGYVVLIRLSVTQNGPKGVADAKAATTRAHAVVASLKRVTKANTALVFAAAEGAGLGSTSGLVAAIKDAVPALAPSPAPTYVPTPQPPPKAPF